MQYFCFQCNKLFVDLAPGKVSHLVPGLRTENLLPGGGFTQHPCPNGHKTTPSISFNKAVFHGVQMAIPLIPLAALYTLIPFWIAVLCYLLAAVMFLMKASEWSHAAGTIKSMAPNAKGAAFGIFIGIVIAIPLGKLFARILFSLVS
jgi:hypothetical protein